MATASIDTAGLERRATEIAARPVRDDARQQALRLALSMVDLTTLEGRDTPARVSSLCRKARRPSELDPTLPTVAAVCVYPRFVALAKSELSDTTIRVASVATAFPSGQYPLSVRLSDVQHAVSDGADEVDMVINRGAFLSGDDETVVREIRETKQCCGSAHLKVILETGELETYENVRRASELAIEGGADFIKTSTGKVQPAATLPVTLVMLQVIRDHFCRTGRVVGMKPAGGISTAKVAIQYLLLVREILGPDWMTRDRFRFGASSLANDLIRNIVDAGADRRLARYHFSEA
jgi:deoxyribose-phosphate aldolase